MIDLLRPAYGATSLIVALALASSQSPGTVLTADDIEGDFLYRRPFPVEGRQWIALAAGVDGPVIARASVRWNAGLDAGDSTFTLSVAPPNPTLLIAGVTQLGVGPAVQATRGPEPLTPDWRTHELTLRQASYTLSLTSSDPALCDATVSLSDEERSQALYGPDDQAFACDEPHFTLDWAGDLDGDGHLDLVTTLSSKYSYYPRRLWLSSTAGAGELVGLVAEYAGGD